MLFITKANLRKDPKIWYNLQRHGKSRTEPNQEKKYLRQCFNIKKFNVLLI